MAKRRQGRPHLANYLSALGDDIAALPELNSEVSTREEPNADIQAAAKRFVSSFRETIFRNEFDDIIDGDVAGRAESLARLLTRTFGQAVYDIGYGDGFIDGTNAPHSRKDLDELLEGEE